MRRSFFNYMSQFVPLYDKIGKEFIKLKGAVLMAQLFFRYGSMNSGKTIEILKVAHNYEEQNKTVAIFTSGIDDRDQVGFISSRIGLKREATPIFSDTNILKS